MAKLENAIVKILYHVCALLMMVMATVVTAQVVSRYVFGNPFTWTEELARYVFVWMSMLGMAVGVKYGSHIALDILVKKLQGTPRKVLVAVNQLFILAFTVTLTYSDSSSCSSAPGRRARPSGCPWNGFTSSFRCPAS